MGESDSGAACSWVTERKLINMPVRKLLLPTVCHDEGNRKQQRSIPLLWYLALAFMVCVYGSYGVLINLSKVDNRIPFSSPALNFLVETFKFLVAATLLTLEKRGDVKGMGGWCCWWKWWRRDMPSMRRAAPFAVPAILYSFNNNLAVFMQTHMDPATFQVLGNLKIVTTAILYRLILKRPLSIQQWISVLLLTTAGICDSMGNLAEQVETVDLQEQYVTVTGLVTILTYCLISALAGVYTEFILKRDLSTSLYVQNMTLYSFSLSINLAAWLLAHAVSFTSDTGGPGELEESSFYLLKGFSIYTWLIILTQVFNGLGMSVVFKHGNNMVRLLVISCAMVVSSVLSTAVLGVTLNAFFFMTLAMVVAAIYLYYI